MKLLGLVASAFILASACARAPEPAPKEVGWTHVYVRVPEDRLGEFAEGDGLLRRADPSEVADAKDVWFGYFPRYYLASLRERGFSLMVPTRSDLAPLAVSPGEVCSPPPRDPESLPIASSRFCPYSGASYLFECKRTIQRELEEVPKDFPPIGSTTYALSFPFGETPEKRKIWAVRVGKTSLLATDPPVPQLVVYGTQHAREWGSAESLMQLFRFLATSYKNDTFGVRQLLANVAVVIVPVANPDGYDFTHAVDGKRFWRPTREVCPDGSSKGGVDLNRNFETGWGEPGSTPTCADDENSIYRGPTANSAPETKALLDLLANRNLFGSYRTRFSLNVHTFGNLLLFPEGLSKDDLGPCTTDTNCTAPDHGILQSLLGSERTTQLTDEETGRAYLSGSGFRQMYAMSGDSVTSGVYGSESRPNDPRFYSALVELTNTPCGFAAEDMSQEQFDVVANRLRSLVRTVAGRLPEIHSGAVNPSFELPHLHRRQVVGRAAEFPTLRVSAKTSLGTQVAILGAGTTEIDDVRSGVTYAMFRTRSTDPYVFPPELPLCVSQKCKDTAVLADPGDGKIKLCDPDRFTTGGSGWSFTGDNTQSDTKEECFWTYAGASGGTLSSRTWSIASMVKAKLVFSIRRRPSDRMNVLVSTNGFQNCSVLPGTGCRIVREYPGGEHNVAAQDGRYRTEILDVADFDRAPSIQVRFEAKTGRIDVFDPILIGWKG